MVEISVIIPVYNTELYLETCIKSVIHSTIFQKCEIILIDDGSTDGSLNIISKYVDEYENIISYGYDNKGISVARNRGIEKACGKYIFFLDSDDFILQDYLQKLYNAIEKEKCDIVYAGFSRTTGFDSSIVCVKREVLSLQKVMKGDRYLEYRMRTGDWENQVWCAIYRKEMLISMDLKFCEKIRIYEDILFTNRVLLYANRVYMIPEYGYMYRIRKGSLVQSGLRKMEIDNCIRILKEFTKEYDNFNASQKHAVGRVYFEVISMILYRIGKINPPDKIKYYRELDELDLWNEMKFSMTTFKEKMKLFIFKLNWELYYQLVKW